MTKILFVCHGNICRSPAAELLFRRMIVQAGLSEDFKVDSAATTSEELGNPVYPPMRRLLEERGFDCSGMVARRVRRSEYDDWDLFIGMDDENRWDLRRIFHGDPERKIRNLPSFSHPPKDEIADPWYTRDFAGSLEEIEEACYGLLESLTGVVFLDFTSCGDIPSLYGELRHKMGWEDWYGENLDALYDVLTGLPCRGSRYLLRMPSADAPAEVRLYADRILTVFQDAEKGDALDER